MSKKLILGGIKALKEVVQREVSGGPKDRRQTAFLVRPPFIPDDRPGLVSTQDPKYLYKHHKAFNDNFTLEKYKDRLNNFFEPKGGIPVVARGQKERPHKNFTLEYRPDFYKDPSTAKKHRDILIKHGGVPTPTGSVYFVDSNDLDQIIINTIKK